MTTFRGILEITAEEWLAELGWTLADVPDLVVVEGTWWREARTRWRLGYLTDVQELPFPDIFTGSWKGRRVAFCCAYGAARTAEVIHLFGMLGTRLAVQIGTCGGLQQHLRPGDVVVPDRAIALDGVAPLYGAADSAGGSAAWSARARDLLQQRGCVVHRGVHLTWPTLFAQTGELCAGWHAQGYLSVDMETATTFAVSERFGMPATSLLVVWDELTRGRSFLDPLSGSDRDALDRSNAAVFEVALRLAEHLGGDGHTGVP